MPRYLIRKCERRSQFRAETDCDWWEGERPAPPTVDDAAPTNTGLLDAAGNEIWRAPNPIGFGRDDEW